LLLPTILGFEYLFIGFLLVNEFRADIQRYLL